MSDGQSYCEARERWLAEHPEEAKAEREAAAKRAKRKEEEMSDTMSSLRERCEWLIDHPFQFRTATEAKEIAEILYERELRENQRLLAKAQARLIEEERRREIDEAG